MANITIGFCVLLLYQLFGEVIVHVLSLPVPGAVVGLLLLFFTLLWKGPHLLERLQKVSNGLLNNLSLLFVPSTVGIMVYFHYIAQQWLPIFMAVIIGALITIVVTGLTLQFLIQREDKKQHSQEEHF